MRAACLLALVLVGSASANEFTRGENLIVPITGVLSDYDRYVKNEGTVASTKWLHKEIEGDVFVLHIVDERRPDPLAMRRHSDDGETLGCLPGYEVHTVEDAVRNGYRTIHWRTKCPREGAPTRYSLQASIGGKDKLYYLIRIWDEEPTDDEYNIWLGLMNEIVVCDTRGREHPCPEGYSKAESPN